MTHDRPYRQGLPTEAALAEIRGGAGSQFDPRLAALFLEHAESLVVPSVDEPPDAARPYTQGLLLPA